MDLEEEFERLESVRLSGRGFAQRAGELWDHDNYLESQGIQAEVFGAALTSIALNLTFLSGVISVVIKDEMEDR